MDKDKPIPGLTGEEALVLRGQSFPAWAFSTFHRLHKAAGVGSILAAAFTISYLEPGQWFTLWWNGQLTAHLESKASVRASLSFVQASACMLLALLTPKARLWLSNKIEPVRWELANLACRRIRTNLVLVFFVWALYYSVSGFRLMGGGAAVDRPALIMLSTITSLLLFWLYLELGELTVEEMPNERPKAGPHGGLRSVARWAFTDVRQLRVVGVGLGIVVIGLAWYGQMAHFRNVVDLVDSIVGCLSGVGLCLVVGRLGSKYLDPGPITMSLLYFYGVIQVGASQFETDALMQFAITTLALPLKVLLWLVCVWAFTTGSLGEYVYEIRLLIEKLGERRSGLDSAR